MHGSREVEKVRPQRSKFEGYADRKAFKQTQRRKARSAKQQRLAQH